MANGATLRVTHGTNLAHFNSLLLEVVPDFVIAFIRLDDDFSRVCVELEGGRLERDGFGKDAFDVNVKPYSFARRKCRYVHMRLPAHRRTVDLANRQDQPARPGG